jgi:hypothetical protein
MGHLLRQKKEKERERDMTKEKEEDKDPYLPSKKCKIRSSKTRNIPSVSPFPPSPSNILPSIRSGFDQVPISCKPLFGLATYVTKVCYTLPTHKSTYQLQSRKKVVKNFDHGEDYTP